MQRSALSVGGLIAAMVLCAVVVFFGNIYLLMELGTARHRNYEYYGQFPLLVWGAAVVAFLLPAAIAWWIAAMKKGDWSGWFDGFRLSVGLRMPIVGKLVSVVA
jgi:hypothetical protein